jgi:hypothetical protein
MSLNLTKILPQISDLGETIAKQHRLQLETIPRAREGLTQAGQMGNKALRERVAAAGDRWPGAAPSDEPVDQIYPAPTPPPSFTVIGADGSQIYPDRHAAAFYYMINVASIRVTHGSNQIPITDQQPELFSSQEDLYDPQDRPIQAAMVNLRRDVTEMQALAEAASKVDVPPVFALLDNSLLLWMTLEAEGSARHEIDQRLAQYLQAIDRLRADHVALAGFIDRPRNANTLALIHLAQLSQEHITPEALRPNPYRGLTDLDLFRTLLPVGSRSARFIHTSPLNKDFEAAGHQVQYFYLNPGLEDQIVRVEIPAWVGEQTALLDQLHAALLYECRTTGGFPYVLVRAHELAVISPRERQLLEQQIERILLQAGDFRGPSQKSITKGWTQNRRRHRL